MLLLSFSTGPSVHLVLIYIFWHLSLTSKKLISQAVNHRSANPVLSCGFDPSLLWNSPQRQQQQRKGWKRSRDQYTVIKYMIFTLWQQPASAPPCAPHTEGQICELVCSSLLCLPLIPAAASSPQPASLPNPPPPPPQPPSSAALPSFSYVTPARIIVWPRRFHTKG